MRLQATTTLATYGLLTLAGGVALTMPTQLPATAGTTATSSDTVRVLGSVRDFLSTHPDFGDSVAGVSGHYANNLARTLGSDNRPTFWGAGFRVDNQWRQDDGYPIPPHHYMGPDILVVGSGIIQDTGTVIDTWDSSLGPYNKVSNSGGLPSVRVGDLMPVVQEPAMSVPFSGDAIFSGNSTTTISSDVHCRNLVINDRHKLNVSGDITILCEENMDMRDNAVITLANATSRLTIYVKGTIGIQDSILPKDFYEPDRLTIISLEGEQVRIGDGAEIYGYIIAPDSTVLMQDTGEIYGKLFADTLEMEGSSQFHMDMTPLPAPCGGEYLDTPGSYGAFSTGGITSSATFDEWFHDTLGVNLSESHIITLTKNGSGVYEYLDDSFFPIDGRLHGNEGATNNSNFTYQFRVDFTHRACTDTFFSFEGNDDAWMFVDDKLAMDLGGVTPGTPQHVELDRLGLVDGQTYSIRFFYAHRTPGTAVFRVRTNAELNTDIADMTVSGGFD